jgi:catechol 2,3-dioxygenase-like lactoylglutathione lyase family enzyme
MPRPGNTAIETPRARQVDLKLEAFAIPVADVDRAKKFYGSLGWRLDADFAFDNGFRVVQFTPPGSGLLDPIRHEPHVGRARLSPGPVPDRLRHRGWARRARRLRCKISEVFHAGTPGAQFQPDGTSGRVSGPAPDHASYRSYATFSDPDGNRWLLQEVTTRLPGRVDTAETAFASAADLANALRRAAAAHGEHEKRTSGPHNDWPEWYAEYMVREQAGKPLPS